MTVPQSFDWFNYQHKQLAISKGLVGLLPERLLYVDNRSFVLLLASKALRSIFSDISLLLNLLYIFFHVWGERDARIFNDLSNILLGYLHSSSSLWTASSRASLSVDWVLNRQSIPLIVTSLGGFLGIFVCCPFWMHSQFLKWGAECISRWVSFPTLRSVPAKNMLEYLMSLITSSSSWIPPDWIDSFVFFT